MKPFCIDTNVWSGPGGNILKEALRQEARALHQMHQPPASLREWSAMRGRIRRKLLDAAGSFPAPPALELREHGTIKLEGYRITKLTYQSRPGLRVSAHLMRPDGPGPFPAILNMHGHWAQGKIAARVAGRCQVFAREGFVVLSVDAIGAGERGTFPNKFEHHGRQGTPLFSIGETLLGMQVYDNMRGIDLLQSLDYVDGARIGATGASGGGNQTMWVSALDPRVKVSVPVVSAGTFEAYVTNHNCMCETLPGGLQITEEWGVLGLVAPNPLLILTALREGIPAFFMQEMLRSYADARKVYALYGKEERIAYQAPDLPHGYWPEMQRHALGWFKHWLTGEASALPRALPVVPEFPESRLMCFPGKSRPGELISLRDYVRLRCGRCRKEYLALKKISRAQKLKGLRRLLRLESGPAFQHCSAPVRGEAGGMLFEKFTVAPSPGALVPCLLLKPRRKTPGAITIALHPEGKLSCLKEPTAQAILRQGRALCLADLRHTGETKWDHPDSKEHLPSFRAELWLGRTMIGQWVKDILAIRAALAGRGHGRGGIELLAFGEPALAVLAAAALAENFDAVSVEKLPATYVTPQTPPAQRYSIYVPGILQWGDVTLIAALANCPVRVRSLANHSNKILSRPEHLAWLREARKMAGRTGRRMQIT
ncbi:MAG: acetylxylan esterase [Kiritimatiellia bacterium]